MVLENLRQTQSFMKVSFMLVKKKDKANQLSAMEAFFKGNSSKDCQREKAFTHAMAKFSLEHGLVGNVFYQTQFLIMFIVNSVGLFLIHKQLMRVNTKGCANCKVN